MGLVRGGDIIKSMRIGAPVLRNVLLGTVSSFFLLVAVAHAQFTPFTFGTSVSIGLDPLYPKPGETIHLTVEGSGIDFDSSAITWYVGDKVLAQGVGVTSADVVAGELGSEQAVELDVDTPDGIRTVHAVIAPADMDVLISSDSYVPPFYRGRALPSAGTNLIAQAVPHFVRADGTLIPDSQITFTWKRSGEVLGSLSGRGKSSAVIPVVHLSTQDDITVVAVSADGTRSAETTILMPTVDPVLDLYEDHPLYGVLYNKALGATASIPESEMAFFAVPYFSQARSPGDSALSYAWKVNDTAITSSASTPNELTINADNSTGQAQIALEVTHATNFLMDASGEWGVTLSTGTASQDVFRAPLQ